MADEVVTIKLTLNKDEAVKALKDIEKRSDDSGEKAGKRYGDGFSDGATKGIKSVGKALFGLRNVVQTAIAAIGGLAIGKEIVEAAGRQQEAVNSLNASLQTIGEFSEATSRDLQNFASELQEVTKFGDEAVIEQLAFAQAMGASAEQSKAVVKASADLAAALNIDLNSATRNVAKTLGGFAGELGEVIPELKALSTSQLQAGAGIDLIAKKYSGFAEKELGAFNVQVTQASNLYGDLLEELGATVTNSDNATEGIVEVKGALKDLITLVKQNKTEIGDFFNSIVDALITEPIKFWAAEIKGAVKPVKDLEAELASLDAQIEKTTSFINENRDNFFANASLFGDTKIEQETETLSKLLEARTRIAEQISEIKKLTEQPVAAPSTSEGPDTESLKERTLAALNEIGVITLEQLNEQETKKLEQLEAARELEVLTEQEYAQQKLLIEQDFQNKRQKIIGKSLNKINQANKIAERSLANSLVSGVQTMISALQTGENATDAFKSFIFSAFGDLATQLGSFYIAQGIANAALFSLDPTGTIAAGIGLVALGQLIKGFAGGGLGGFNSAGGSTGVAIGETSPAALDDFATTEPEDIEAEQKVTINIQGDVLDSEETGLRIANLLNDAVDSQGVQIRTGAFA